MINNALISSVVTPKKILTPLVNKYEKSKSFVGLNKVAQSFSVRVSDLFPKYADEAELDWFRAVNETLCDLEKKGFVRVARQKNSVANLVLLEVEAIEQIYLFLNRTPKREVLLDLMVVLRQYEHSNSVLSSYCQSQLTRIEANKSVEYFDGDFTKYQSVLEVLANILNVETETFERDFSIRVLGDSKAFGGIKGTVEAILRKYGDFPESETLLADLNIIKNPGHVYFKGNGRIDIGGQVIDCTKLNGDIAFSSLMLNDIVAIDVLGNNVVTIENLTTFNALSCKDSFAIYLGGYHNEVRRSFIRKVYVQNADKRYLHFGDIDAGGFYILEHLRNRTEIPFEAFCMDTQTLKDYFKYTKTLSKSDRTRLTSMLGSEFDATIRFMLDHDCKLEQEAIDLSAITL